MTLQADLDQLGAQSNALHLLGGEALELSARPGVPVTTLLPGGDSDSLLRAVTEASRLANGIEEKLLPVLSGRLHEIGNLMHAATIQFRTAEDANEEALAAIYLKASGEWGPPK
ncbi:hypothetical protein ACWDYH_36185 [Nocardia goodfellowii]